MEVAVKAFSVQYLVETVRAQYPFGPLQQGLLVGLLDTPTYRLGTATRRQSVTTTTNATTDAASTARAVNTTKPAATPAVVRRRPASPAPA